MLGLDGEGDVFGVIIVGCGWCVVCDGEFCDEKVCGGCEVDGVVLYGVFFGW